MHIAILYVGSSFFFYCYFFLGIFLPHAMQNKIT
jgi:hypothetical protein